MKHREGEFSIGGDLALRRPGFGSMHISSSGVSGEPRNHEATRLLTRVVELGINLIDTTDAYGPELSERTIAETLYPYPRDLESCDQGRRYATAKPAMSSR